MVVDLDGISGSHQVSMTSLHAASFDATNSITDPEFIHPVTSSIAMDGDHWKHTVPALTIEVMDIAMQ